jgi:glutamine synthetase
MLLKPEVGTAFLDPFTADSTIIVICDVYDIYKNELYAKCPRSIAKKALKYAEETGIADAAYFGPENEFFIFDDVRYDVQMKGNFFEIGSEEAAWETGAKYDGGNLAHKPGIKGGYFPVPPVDSLHEIRSSMCESMQEMGLGIEVHHHEVATAGQCEIGAKFNTLVRKADEVQTYKYCVHNTAAAYGKTATFMPKPLVGDNGNGMHVHQSLFKNGEPIFYDKDGYSELSQEAIWYIGGIIKHGKALNAFTNASTNSYKRLVPGFEAPTILTYSARNRSAAIRIPWVDSSKARRIEVRFPDSTANPYLCFSALLMAGLDGIKNKIEPVGPGDEDLFENPEKSAKKYPTVAKSLEEALGALDKDRAFLKEGDVFSNDLIDGYIALKSEDVTYLNQTTSPVEFDMYYSV